MYLCLVAKQHLASTLYTVAVSSWQCVWRALRFWDWCYTFTLQLSKTSGCKVFATDAILATLMTCARSKYSWDVVVQVCVCGPTQSTCITCAGLYTFTTIVIFRHVVIFKWFSNLEVVLSRPGVPAILLQYSCMFFLLCSVLVISCSSTNEMTLNLVSMYIQYSLIMSLQFWAKILHVSFTFSLESYLGYPSLLSSSIFPSPSLLPSLNFPVPFLLSLLLPVPLPYSPSIFPSADFLTVSETAKEPPQDETGINCPNSLAMEATYINQNFSQQMLVVSLSVCLSVFYQSVWCLSDCLSVYLSIFWL